MRTTRFVAGSIRSRAPPSASTQLTFDATRKDQTPEWSPDGTQIVYTVDASPTVGGGDLWVVMNADGSNQHAITSGPEREYGPVWSPDGTQIAFLDFGSRTVYVMNADGTRGATPSIPAASSSFLLGSPTRTTKTSSRRR